MKNVNSVVQKYVEEKKTDVVRSTLARLAYVGDKESFYFFKDSTEYASENLDDLFVKDDGDVLNSASTLDNYKEITKKMMDNFSKFKYEKVISIGMTIFNQTEKKSEVQAARRVEDDSFSFASSPKVNSTAKYIMIAVVVVLIIIAIICLITR